MSTKFIDFGEVKSKHSLADVCTKMLGIELQPVRDSDKLKGKCPFCNNPSAFKVTPSAGRDGKGLAGCFQCGTAGLDAIGVVAKVKGISSQEAALAITRHFEGTVPVTVNSDSTVSKARANEAKGFDFEAYADKLDTEHEGLSVLGLSPETLREFRAGYSKAGQNQGRLAVAICDRHGAIVGFCGITLHDESPALKFPNGINPDGLIFNAHRVASGEVYLVRDPVAVLKAYESGIENCVCLLTETISAMQLQMLAALMDEKNVSYMEMY